MRRRPSTPVTSFEPVLRLVFVTVASFRWTEKTV